MREKCLRSAARGGWSPVAAPPAPPADPPSTGCRPARSTSHRRIPHSRVPVLVRPSCRRQLPANAPHAATIPPEGSSTATAMHRSRHGRASYRAPLPCQRRRQRSAAACPLASLDQLSDPGRTERAAQRSVMATARLVVAIVARFAKVGRGRAVSRQAVGFELRVELGGGQVGALAGQLALVRALRGAATFSLLRRPGRSSVPLSEGQRPARARSSPGPRRGQPERPRARTCSRELPHRWARGHRGSRGFQPPIVGIDLALRQDRAASPRDIWRPAP